MSKRPPPDPVAHRTISSSWVHNAARGIVSVVAADGENRVISQGRDGTIKYWDIGENGLSGTPLTTIKTNSYHFCKLSILNNPNAKVEKTELESSVNVEGPNYVAVAGEDLSVVEIGMLILLKSL
ncbi:hypothetical protein RD792_006206 [Penstemon davidsonii]|uniref:Uncharacterized protein n=1 Tax=Penstemon davidsonii TaxID=160366 RepID=A0ABR0DCF4_9LAMI|nr:hypothetical protein RD792_006206 [Penstemon davidsonii]